MKNSKSEKRKNKYMASIIQSLRMNVTDFMYNLSAGENFEVTIYQWSINLFEEGKTTGEALKIIEERIIKVTRSYTHRYQGNRDDLNVLKKYNRVITELETRKLYNSLGNLEKYELQEKVIAFVETRLWSYPEIVDFVIKIIQLNKNIEESDTKESDSTDSKRKLNYNNSGIISGIKNYLQSPTPIILNPKIISSSLHS